MATQGVTVVDRTDVGSSPQEYSKSEGQIQRSNTAGHWRLSARILFRFLFAYLVLYILPFPLNIIPNTSFADQAYLSLWNYEERVDIRLRAATDRISATGRCERD
jgi:hypothetical protein